MEIKQFEDKALSHFSYAILDQGKVALVDPGRDPGPYYQYAQDEGAEIVAVFETHPHADFISCHLQVHEETGAKIFVSGKVGADYPHETFEEGDSVTMGSVEFTALDTPGHSPDSITIVAKGKENELALFTGDTLFIGDVGRPDLRESSGNMQSKREELAEMMYDTIQNKFTDIPDGAMVYPAHGAGSLCGKNMSSAASSTLGNERQGNWAFSVNDKQEFMDRLLDQPPMIPHYFSHAVGINKEGAENLQHQVASVPLRLYAIDVDGDCKVVDTRDEQAFKSRHLPNSINIMARTEDDKFETWLGSMIKPGEAFYLVVDKVQQAKEVMLRVAKIGYESQVKAIVTLGQGEDLKCERELALGTFTSHPERFTIVDVRNKSETSDGLIFDNALPIPLNELRESVDKIPTDKPVVVHCAGGYRSAAGSSLLSAELQAEVYDLSEAVKEFK